ncbi:MAG: hypothetical protein GEU88_07630 [Solirubrobacterales bacterium]|nr:hypothetical protein [Solirubrobacterales bacterium]
MPLSRRIRNYIRHNVLGVVAIFIALGGTATASHLVVRSSDIVDGEVRNPDIRAGAVTAKKLAPDAIPANPCTSFCFGGSPKIANRAVGRSEIGLWAVGGSQIAPGSVEATQLGGISEVTKSVSVSPNGHAGVTAPCPAGTRVIGGGFNSPDRILQITESRRVGNGWTAHFKNEDSSTLDGIAIAYCLGG